MTNHWIDLKNADVILAMGANPAENHPVSFKWVTEAMDDGATLISVDPRYTRTSALAHVYTSLRPGTDIAFLGGMILHILENRLYHEEYLVEHTNASYLVGPSFEFDDGLFSGLDEESESYDRSRWSFQLDEGGVPVRDTTLRDPRCVLRLLADHYSRYDTETVSRITGTSEEDLLRVYRTFGATGAADRVGTVMYAMGWTQHTYGTQIIRAAAIIQLLLGNIGRAGGGINALRGESNVQGSTDHCLLYHLLPGYLKPPSASQETLERYLAARTPTSSDERSANWWRHYPAYAVSLLKWMFGGEATTENEYGYHWLPKLEDGVDYSWLSLFDAMYSGSIKGLICWGQNPAVSGANCNKNRLAMERLDWMVAVNLWDTETSSFWRRPGVDPRTIDTEVFLLPCAASVEKEGSVTNSGRWAQWRWKAADPPGEAKPDSWILNGLAHRLRALEREDPGPAPEPLLNLSWPYEEGEVDPHRVAREINGWAVSDVVGTDMEVIASAGEQLSSFSQLRSDGSTASGNWLYCGSYTQEGNMMARRDDRDVHPAGIGLYSSWAWAWPLNRRVLYNRASCDGRGEPFDSRRFAIRWDEGRRRWEGDVPDGGWPPGAKHAFIMIREGHARIFGPGLADGPFPEHYEPWESPVHNLLHEGQDCNPVAKIWRSEMDRRGGPERYPLVATTYRVTEHWQSGAMTRNVPWLVEMQPEMFVEMSRELAADRGISNGDRVVVESARGSIEAVAVVTPRIRPFRIDGDLVHQVGLPWHWGYRGLSTGGSANELTPPVGDANTKIPETKAFLCNLRRA